MAPRLMIAFSCARAARRAPWCSKNSWQNGSWHKLIQEVVGRRGRKGQQPPWIVSDELRVRIEPRLPVVPRRTDHPGRQHPDDRKVPCGILFVVCTTIQYEFLPLELGFGSGMTCWQRLPRPNWLDNTI